MSKSPLVLVTTVTSTDHVQMARQQIISTILEVGLIPVVVSGDMPQKSIDHIYKNCSGVVIPGGADIHPNNYDEEVSPKTVLGEPFRDKLEINLAKRAIVDKKPILGICRGMQILWVSQGGKLIQHLPEVTKELHGNDQPVYKDLYNDDSVHKIFLETGTKIAEIWQPLSNGGFVKVPSMHHQAANEKSLSNFIISARSKEKITEAIELPSSVHPFCVGVQGHPEAWIFSRNPNKKLLPKLLFGAFARSIK